MPTLTLPRAAGSRAGAAVVLTALAAAGASWVAAPEAAAQGENGDIRIHDERHLREPLVGSAKDDPVVCRFYLEAVNFDTLTAVAYTITPQPPLPTAATVTGTIQLAGGAGHTDPLGLADGQYKLSWAVGTPVALKEKVFRVNCKDGRHEGDRGDNGPNGQIADHQQNDGSWGQGGDHDGPKGGVHAGGGGLIDTAAAYAPVAAAGAVGLVAVGGAVYVRRNRRRPHGAA
ncbi:hypothetical protein [Streptomyces capoamus]|uniref:Uncharacterized protein n=1 Tax=Streptomyces capoamus TaxID=68183 RepID=A0A919F2I1_9ACTN|nr:hypothetical protein [Streptomyces capoamus]GGW19340.1 hypothetical protein GCM10010501_54960 [Streptomyces libani subsp. rufus]GHG71491.1 hypothetical protein GCM10018980_66820 [Streptomyces capoamus]